MNKFTAALVATVGTVSAQIIDCADAVTNGGLPISEAACNRFPFIAEAVEFDCNNYSWDIIDVQTADGADISLINFLGDSDFNLLPGQGTKGPVLLRHGLEEDAYSWFSGSPNITFTPCKLFAAGYDVYIEQGRGKGDALTAPPQTEEFWDFNFETIGTEDLQAEVRAILESRAANLNVCEKVQVINYDAAAQTTAIGLLSQPTSSAAYISNVVNQVPCMVYKSDVIEGIFADPSDDRRRLNEARELGSSYSYYYHQPSHYYCDKTPYYAKFNEIRNELSYEEYHKFYNHFMQWRYTGDNWWACDDSVFDAINDALCKVQPSNSDCQPANQARFYALINALRDAGFYSLYGDRADEQVAAVCAALGDESNECKNLTSIVGNLSRQGPCETSLQVLEHAYQQSQYGEFTAYNSNFELDGWFTAGSPFALEDITNRMYNEFVQGDQLCDEVLNESILDRVPSQVKSALWKDGTTHSGSQALQTCANEGAFEQLLSELESIPESADCAALADAWV